MAITLNSSPRWKRATSLRSGVRKRNLNRVGEGGLFNQGSEQGSISLLTIGLFVLTVSMLILVTDIAAMAVAKRSLLHASESAAIRAAHNLDLAAYYRGVSGVKIPIDCQMAYAQVIEELNQWLQGDSEFKREELEAAQLVEFNCAGNRVRLVTSARARLPFVLPGSSMNYLEVNATVTAESDQKG